LVLGAFLFLAWSALSLPATFTIVATSLEARQHTMGIGIQSMVRRIPMMIGPLVGGWLITRFGFERGVQYCLWICIGLTLLTMGFQGLMLERSHTLDAGQVEAKAETPLKLSSFFIVVRSFSPTLRELLISDILIRFCERIPYAFIVLWAMNHVGTSAQKYGTLVAVEMVTAMVCYIPVAHLTRKYGHRRFVLVTFVFFTLFPVTLLFAQTANWLMLAFVVRGLKEFGEPARKAMIISQAPSTYRAMTYGAYYLIRDCIVTSGSFVGAALWNVSPHANFIGAGVCGGLGTIWFWYFIFRKRANVT
jgi:MFS family permease